jgi:hypothetical protein
MSIAPASLLSFANLSADASYQLQVFSDYTWANSGAPFTVFGSTFTQYVSGAAGPNGYRLAATPVPAQAYATAQTDNGFVVGATVTSGGWGYTTNPPVSILSNGSGSNATAIATLSNGVVTAITITSAGTGYANAPTILIAPPPVNALLPVVTQAMELNLSNLSPYENYQLEFSPVVTGPWTNLSLPFVPTATTNIQYTPGTGSAGFFRVRYE